MIDRGQIGATALVFVHAGQTIQNNLVDSCETFFQSILLIVGLIAQSRHFVLHHFLRERPDPFVDLHLHVAQRLQQSAVDGIVGERRCQSTRPGGAALTSVVTRRDGS